ncbi:hypothetical protein FKG94_22685 [Exilibacterium tricleocarpae]|uniref:Cysteine-rich CPCC domain-containing protein n=1 Tax=Exilibacterium tricleocarpae TaxID=2591008 RepID=A0A545SXC1_9GAMM|nr:hypothetical protein FKG94_22685 [Exilibacterium tricleocarpae]
MKREQAINGLFVCPCCGYATLGEICNYEICGICFWEDDGQDDLETGECWGGPNYISLEEGRLNFLKIGVSDPKDKRCVRRPKESDINFSKYKISNGTVVRAENT